MTIYTLMVQEVYVGCVEYDTIYSMHSMDMGCVVRS